MSTGERWRWNVSMMWENFSSLVREVVAAGQAPNSFHRYHHVKAGLYFAVGTLEAFLNGLMRDVLTAQGAGEAAVLGELKSTRFPKKLNQWPSQVVGRAVQTPSTLTELIREFNTLRGEVTHPKGRDHSAYDALDKISMGDVQEAVAQFIVVVQEARGRSFPYWLLGWNFVGMNTDMHWPSLINNSQFIHALAHMGYDVPTFFADAMDAWETENMTSPKGYTALASLLRTAKGCQRRDPRFPFMPRLCREWWDEAHVLSCGMPPKEIRLPRFA